MSNLTSTLSIRLLDEVTKPARTVAQALEQAEKQAKSIAKAMSGDVAATSKFTANLGKLGLAAKDVEKVAGAWRDYSKSAKLASEASNWTKSQLGDVRRWESQTIQALRAVGREEKAFAAAQKKAMAQSHGGGGGKHGYSQWGHGGALGMAAQGAGAAVSAHSVYHLSKEAVMAGAELQHERVVSMNMGRTAGELKEFEDAAKKVAKARPTASYTESMKTLLETTSSFGSTEHAIEHLDFMMKTASVLKSSAGDKITESAGELGQKYAKFFEMRGVANDPKRFESEGNAMTRAMVFSGGNFNPNEMFNFASQAKSALRNMDADYMSKVVPSIIGEQGGDKAGTAANAFYNVIMGKARDAKQAKAWMNLGLLDPSKVEMKKGQAVSWSPGAVKNTDMATGNAMKWYETTVLPAMQAKGIDVNNPKELSKINALMFRNGKSNQWAEENSQAADRARLHKDSDLIDKTALPDQMYKNNLQQDATVAITSVTASLNSLAAAATQPAMATAASTLTSIGTALANLAGAAKDHPMAAMATAGGLAAGGMAGAGYMSYQFMNGFGLKTSAVELSAAAAALTGAAEAQGGKSLLDGVTGGGGKSKGLLSRTGKVLKTLPLLGTAVALGVEGYGAIHDSVNADLAPDAVGSRSADRAKQFGPWRPDIAPHRDVLKSQPMMRGDHILAPIKAGAEEAKASLDSINGMRVAPQADASGLDAMIAKLGQISALVATVNSGIGAAGAAASRLKLPSIGGVQRSDFTAGDPGR